MKKSHVLFLIAAFLVAAFAYGFIPLAFGEVSAQSIAGVLMPLFVVALFLERAQEVFINAWRGQERQMLDRDVIKTREAMNLATNVAAQATANNKQKQDAVAARKNLDDKLDELAQYKTGTSRLAYVAGTAGGILIAVAGVRCVWPLLDQTIIIGSFWQHALFKVVDVSLTAGLLAGGSEGIHKIMALITDVVDGTREQVSKKKEGLASE